MMQTSMSAPKSPISRGMTWLGRIRLRLAVYIIGIPLAVAGVVSIGPAWIVLPLVGVAFAAVTMSVNHLAGRMSRPTCFTCGHDLTGEPEGVHGVVCPDCGSLHQHNTGAGEARIAAGESDDADTVA